MKKSILIKGLFLFVLPFTLSSCDEPSTPSEQPSITTPSVEPTPIYLNSPTLNINEENGLVTWNHVTYAEFYTYYINDEALKTTSKTSIELKSGDVLCVMAESSLNHVHSSSWSKPISYIDKNKETEFVNLYFYDTVLKSVKIAKGSTYVPQNPTKIHHIFEGWFLDPYFKTPLTSDYQFNNNTILYPSFIAEDWIKNTNYWIKASTHISSNVISTIASNSGWRFIPLTLDGEKSNYYNATVFSAVISVNGVDANNIANYLVMDGTFDSSGRTYFKDVDVTTGLKVDFSIKSNGQYKIYFSKDHTWDRGSYKVHCYCEQLVSSSYSIYNERNYPKFLLNNSQLEVPTLTLNYENEMVSWSVVEGATKYEYIIDNGDVKETTSNNINLYKGSFISVRAIGEGNYLSSRWSRPTYQIEQIKTSNNIYLYYYGIDRPATKLDVGDKANRPINNPVKPNYVFDDWYVDITYKTKFNFDTPLIKNTVVYAKFIYDNTVKYSLYKANLTTKVGDFEVSHQYEYNEYKISFDVSAINEQFYVMGVDGSKYGPYVISEVGPHRMYFSPDHKWDINTSNERNAYWCLETNTYYFSNNKWWDNVYYYVWDNTGKTEKSWPGNVATFVERNDYGEDIYKIEISSSYIGLVFNNKADKQTKDIDISLYASGTGFYLTGDNSPYDVVSYQYK